MSDHSNTGMPDRSTGESVRREMNELRDQIAELKNSLSEMMEAASNKASTWYEDTADRASRVTRQLSDNVQENPGTTATVFIAGGLVGLLVGLMITEGRRRW